MRKDSGGGEPQRPRQPSWGAQRYLAGCRLGLPGQGTGVWLRRSPEQTWAHGVLSGRAETAAQRAEVLKDFSRSSSSASSFASVVEETEGVDVDDTGLVRGPGNVGALQWPGGGLFVPRRCCRQKHELGCD